MRISQQHMVAVAGQDAGVRGAGAVKRLLKPRYATRKDHEMWAEELREIADQTGLDRMYSATPCPTIAEIVLRFAEKQTPEVLNEALAEAMREWQLG